MLNLESRIFLLCMRGNSAISDMKLQYECKGWILLFFPLLNYKLCATFIILYVIYLKAHKNRLVLKII